MGTSVNYSPMFRASLLLSLQSKQGKNGKCPSREMHRVVVAEQLLYNKLFCVWLFVNFAFIIFLNPKCFYKYSGYAPRLYGLCIRKDKEGLEKNSLKPPQNLNPTIQWPKTITWTMLSLSKKKIGYTLFFTFWLHNRSISAGLEQI